MIRSSKKNLILVLDYGEFDESKIHLILSSFFLCIFKGLMFFLMQIYGIFVKFMFCRCLEKKKQEKQHIELKTRKQQNLAKTRGPKSRHRLKNVATSFQSRDIR